MTSEALHIESQCRGCFHSESVVIDILIEESSARLSIGYTDGGSRKVIADQNAIKPSKARDIIDHFLGLLGTRQRLAGDRSTTVYNVHAIWTIGGSKSEWQAISSELPLEVMNEVLAGDLDSLTKQMVRQSRVGYFNLAHELHTTALALAKEHMA